jgi:hypothetical protein
VGTNFKVTILKDLPQFSLFPEQILHIGKSSRGWCFSLRIYPEFNINSISDWEVLFSIPDAVEIEDEYGRLTSTSEMLDCINRTGEWTDCARLGWQLRRHPIEDYGRISNTRCVGHGTGNFDYLIGEFS